MVLQVDAVRQAADVVAMAVVHVVAVLANLVKVLLAMVMGRVTVVVLQPSARRKVAVVVRLAVAVVVLMEVLAVLTTLAIKVILATVVVMTSNPATFAMTQVAT
jgi:hypothetical protein